jgi:hypothetical protein
MERITVAAKSLVVGNDDGFAIAFDDAQGDRALIVLDKPATQQLLMRLLRRAYAVDPTAAALGQLGPMDEAPATPCSQIGLAGTAEGEILLAIGIGALAIPALVDRQQLTKLSESLARVLALTA